MHIFFTIESVIFLNIFLGGTTLGWGGDMSPPSPLGLTPMLGTHSKKVSFKFKFKRGE